VLTLIRDLVLCATFVALAVALGFALVHLPNVELISLVVFFSGYFLGSRRGLLIGFLSMSLFTTFNPMGLPVVPVAMAQIGSMAVIGLMGGLFQGWVCRGFAWIKLAIIGLACTFFYDLSTNVALALSLGLISKMFSVLAAGLAFCILHMVSNLIVFAAVGPFLTTIAPHVRVGRLY
jgi:hypothetical protein